MWKLAGYYAMTGLQSRGDRWRENQCDRRVEGWSATGQDA